MKEITNLNSLYFKSWNNIKHNQKRISVWWGRTFFYYDSKKGKLFYENLSIFGRILRKLFGYKKIYNQKNLWEHLKSKKIVKGKSPSEGFRKVVAEKLQKLTSLKIEFTLKILDRNSSEDEIIELFEQGLDVNVQGLDVYVYNRNPSDTALLHAAQMGRLKVVEYLIEKGADVNIRFDQKGFVAKTPIQHAIFMQHERLILALLNANADVNEKERFGNTALHNALKNLINNQPQPSDKEFKVYHYPGEELEGPKNPKKIIKAILEKKPNLNLRNQRGVTPLYLACETGDLEVVKWLVNSGADINGGEGPYGGEGPPLFVACANQNSPVPIIEFLLENGANPNSTIKLNGQPIHILDYLKHHMGPIPTERLSKIEELFKKYRAEV